MLDYLIHLVSRIGSWGYLVIFLGAMLESAIFLGFVIPGETLALVAGFLAAQGVFQLELVILSVAMGAVLGDSIGYEIGVRLGRPALTHFGARFGLSAARITRADAFFSRHGSKAVFLGRFVSFGRALVPFLAGSAQMPYRKFLAYNVVGAVIWSAVVALLGYMVGASLHVAAHWLGRASEIIGGLFAFVLLIAFVYRWAIRHEAELRRKQGTFLQSPNVAAFRRRFAPQIAFLQMRISPTSYLGLNLTLGALVLIVASWLFGGIAEDVLTGDPLTLVDVQVANWLHERATPSFTRVMLSISDMNGPVAITIYFGLAVLYLMWRHDWYWLVCLGVTVPTGMLLNVLMKYAFHRARPSFEHPILSLTSYSFPSGHAAGSALFYGVVAMLLISRTDRWRPRVVIVLGAFTLVVVVSFSRLYLGVHYLSDVLAGAVEAIAWLSFCLVGMHTYWQHRIHKYTGPNP